jgi:hypothetical protein
MQEVKGISYLTVSFLVFLLATLSIAGLVHTASGSDENLTSRFLGITGLNNCSISSFSESTSGYLTAMTAKINADNAQYNVLITLENGKFFSYSLSGSNFGTGELDRNTYLITAENVLKGYQTFLNASYCSEFEELLSIAMQTQSSSVENHDFALNQDFVLKISNGASAGQTWCTYVEYSRRVEGYPVLGDCFALVISKNGLLTTLMDNMMLYHVATTDVNVTEEQAIAMATPYATGYAQQSGQTIVVTNATIDFERDIGGLRGDNFAMYPTWTVYFTYDKTDKDGVDGYAVAIWADNGQVYYNAPQGWFGSSSNTALSANTSNWQIVALAAGLFVLFPIATTYVKRRARTE